MPSSVSSVIRDAGVDTPPASGPLRQSNRNQAEQVEDAYETRYSTSVEVDDGGLLAERHLPPLANEFQQVPATRERGSLPKEQRIGQHADEPTGASLSENLDSPPRRSGPMVQTAVAEEEPAVARSPGRAEPEQPDRPPQPDNNDQYFNRAGSRRDAGFEAVAGSGQHGSTAQVESKPTVAGKMSDNRTSPVHDGAGSFTREPPPAADALTGRRLEHAVSESNDSPENYRSIPAQSAPITIREPTAELPGERHSPPSTDDGGDRNIPAQRLAAYNTRRDVSDSDQSTVEPKRSAEPEGGDAPEESREAIAVATPSAPLDLASELMANFPAPQAVTVPKARQPAEPSIHIGQVDIIIEDAATPLARAVSSAERSTPFDVSASYWRRL